MGDATNYNNESNCDNWNTMSYNHNGMGSNGTHDCTLGISISTGWQIGRYDQGFLTFCPNCSIPSSFTDPDYGDDYADPCTTTTTTTTRKPMFTDCGGNLTDITYEEITSPNFPDDYPSSVNCTWLITVPKGSKIQIDFANFSVSQ